MHIDPKISGTGDAERQSPPDRPGPSKLEPMLKMTVVVKGKDDNFRPWSETAEITSLSSSGAGFFMPRACEAGRLLSLIMPMPQHMRKYDQDKKLYRIWGLVQHCYESGGDDQAGFHVGVTLIGKDAPEGYANHPNRSYRVGGMHRNGLWKVEELERNFQKRSAIRYWNSIETNLYQLDDKNEPTVTEKSVTENISETGASIFSGLRVSVGDAIKFQTVSPSFSSLCVVRSRRIGVDDRTRIHVEFIENSFPILEIEAPIEEVGEH